MNTFRTRSIATIAATVLAGLALTACGTGTPSDPVAPTGSADAPPAALSGSITYASWSNNQRPTMLKLIEEFEKKHDGVTVNLKVTPYDQYWTKLQTQAASGTMPDVLWLNSTMVELYATEGMLQPLDDVVAEEKIDLANYPQILVDLYTFDGTTWAVPKDQDSQVVFYNKDLFDRAGVEYPEAEWTLDDYRAKAKAISEALSSDNIYGAAMNIDGQSMYYNTIYQFGGHVISEDGTSSGFDDRASKAGIQFWVDIMNEGISPSIQQLTDATGEDWFTSGRAAMFWGGNNKIRNIMDSDVSESVQVVRLPAGVQSATIVNGLGNAVSHNTPNKPLADAFLAYLGSEEAALIQSEAGTGTSAFIGTEGPWLASQPTLDLQIFLDSAQEFGVQLPSSKNTQAWGNLENEFLGQIWTGKLSVEDGMTQLAAQMNDVLAKE